MVTILSGGAIISITTAMACTIVNTMTSTPLLSHQLAPK